MTTSTSDYKFQGQLEATVDVHTMSAADGAMYRTKHARQREVEAIAEAAEPGFAPEKRS